jgi:hypothetical protein
MRLPLLARLGLPGHHRATSGLPSTSDIRAPKSALALISSALHPGTDLLGGGAEGPNLTQRRPMAMRSTGIRYTEIQWFTHHLIY